MSQIFYKKELVSAGQVLDTINYLPVPMIIRPQSRAAWLDMSDISSANMTSSGGLVSKVLDKFGNGNNVQQNTSSAQPKNNTRTQNGLPVLEFAHDGTQNDFMVFDSNIAVNVPFTVFVVAALDATNNQSILSRQTAAIAGQFALVKNGGFAIFQSYAFGSLGNVTGTVKSFTTNPVIHTVTLDEGTPLKYQLNNGTIATDGINLSGYNNSILTSLNLGSSPGGINPMDGWIGEVIIYNTVLTTSEIIQVNQYLSRKWGIAI